MAKERKVPVRIGKRGQLPLVRCTYEARSVEEMTPERVAAILLEEEAEAARVALR